MAEEKNYFQFNGTNFSNWKFRIRTILEEKDLLPYIDKDMNEILEGLDDLQINAHNKNEKKCKSILVKHIGDDILEHIKDKATAKAIYDTLGEVFERKTVSGQLFLRKKLLTLKYSDDKDIKDHILEFDKTVRELKSIGAKLENLDVVCHLLLTLPKSYESLVTALETLQPNQLTLEFVKSRLLDEYAKRNGENETESVRPNGSVAMNAKNQTPKLKCYNCGKPNHKASECRYKRSGGNKRAANLSRNEDDDFDSDSVAFSAIVKDTTKLPNNEDRIVDTWNASTALTGVANRFKKLIMTLDSGATDHMVNDENFFKTIRKLNNPINADVAKKGVSITAERYGTVQGYSQKSNNELLACTMNNVLLMKD